jgi:nickel transport protein
MKALALGLVLSLWLLFMTPAAAFAHAVQTDYFVDLFASQLELQFTATFSTGEPMAEATVLVFAPADRETPWQESQTDAEGHFTFVPDESLVGDWRIEFKQEGHEDIRIVPVDELGIDYQNISHGGNRDFHLMAHLREGLALFSAAGMGAAAIVFQRRWFRAD